MTLIRYAKLEWLLGCEMKFMPTAGVTRRFRIKSTPKIAKAVFTLKT